MMGLRDSFRFIAKYASCCRLLLWLSRRLRSTSVDLGFNPVRPRSLSPSTHVAPSQYSASVDVPTLSGWAALELAEPGNGPAARVAQSRELGAERGRVARQQRVDQAAGFGLAQVGG